MHCTLYSLTNDDDGDGGTIEGCSLCSLAILRNESNFEQSGTVISRVKSVNVSKAVNAIYYNAEAVVHAFVAIHEQFP